MKKKLVEMVQTGKYSISPGYIRTYRMEINIYLIYMYLYI